MYCMIFHTKIMKTTSTSLLDFGESTVASSDLKSKAVSKLLNDKKEKPNFEKINVSDRLFLLIVFNHISIAKIG